jgi:hypothetical protein
MKTLVLSAALLLSISAHAQKITAEQAKSHEGESETVCGWALPYTYRMVSNESDEASDSGVAKPTTGISPRLALALSENATFEE